MVHQDKKHYNPDGPRNYPDSWPPRNKDGIQPCHDASIPVSYRGVCSLPIFHTEQECGLNGGLWEWHQNWNPGKPPCCGGLDYSGQIQPPCDCGECKGSDCRDCPHECRSVIGRYPFTPIGGTSCAPKYLDLVWGCNTKEGCASLPDSDTGAPWVEGGCDCCGPCCPSMIGRKDLYYHETTGILKMGYCSPLVTHGHITDRATCEGTVIGDAVGYWVEIDEAIEMKSTTSGGVCFKGHQDLPFGTRYVTGASQGSCGHGGDVWIPATPMSSKPTGCIPPNSCSDNCGGRQVGVCKDSSGDIEWGVGESDCTGTWSVKECVNQPPCCHRYGGILHPQPGFEKLSFSMTGCACAHHPNKTCEIELYWAGGGPVPINISPWEKFGGINPFKEVRISGDIIDEARMAGQSLAIIGSQGGVPETINIEDTCGLWIGGFTTCEGCGVWKPNFEVVCPGCSYMAHPIGTGSDPSCDTCGFPDYYTGGGSSDSFPGPEACIDFPAIQPANTCIYKNMTLLPACYDFIGDPTRGITPGGSDVTCQECCSEEWLPPTGNCCGRCAGYADMTEGTAIGGTGAGATGGAAGSAGDDYEDVSDSGGSADSSGGTGAAAGSGSGPPSGDGGDPTDGTGPIGGSPGMPGNQGPNNQGNACHSEAFACVQRGGRWIVGEGNDGKRCGNPLTGYRGCSADPPRIVADDCGHTTCEQYATVHPGSCCQSPGMDSPTCSDSKFINQTDCEKAGHWWGPYSGGCRHNIKRGQKCNGGDCDCCEFCPSCTRTVSYNSKSQKIVTAGDRGDVCHLPLGMGEVGGFEYGSVLQGCGLDVEGCSPGALCKTPCNGESPIGKPPPAKCECPQDCPPVFGEEPCWEPCKDCAMVGGKCECGEVKKSQKGNMPPAALCGMEVAGLKYHTSHTPKHVYSDGGKCEIYCNNVGAPYWADRVLACNDFAAQNDPAPDDGPAPGAGGEDGGPGDGDGDDVGDDGGQAGQGGHGGSPDGGGHGGGDAGDGAEEGDFDEGIGGEGGGSGFANVSNMCVGCGELQDRLQPCSGGGDSMGNSCGCGSIDWTDRCQQDFSALSPEANFVNVIYVCRQESSCKEDCDYQGFSRFRRNKCDSDRCGAAHGAHVCEGEGSKWIPPDPPWPGHDRKFRWGAGTGTGDSDGVSSEDSTEGPIGGGGGGLAPPVWGDPKECPCSEIPPGGCDKCARPSPGEVECAGATGFCNGGPQYTDWHPKVPLCQNWFDGTDRNACGHEWFTPPWGYPPVCGSNCGTDGQYPPQLPPVSSENQILKENPEAGVCFWPSPIPPPQGGFNPGDCELACCDIISDCGNNAKERLVNVLKVGECEDENTDNPTWNNKYQCKAAGKCWDKNNNELTHYLNDKTSCLLLNSEFRANTYRFDDNNKRCFNVDNVEINHYFQDEEKCLNAKCFDSNDNELPQYNDNQDACLLNNHSWKRTAAWKGEVTDANPTAYKCISGYDLGRCSCDPQYWNLTRDECDTLRRSKTAPQAVVDKGWIANGWENTIGGCYQRGTNHRIHGDENWVPDCNNYVPQPDYIKSESSCLGLGGCTNECLGQCSGLGSNVVCDGWGTGGDCCKEECTAKNGNWVQRHDYNECASWWSTVWKPQDDPYWFDTQFAKGNQEAAGMWMPPHSWYTPKHIELLGYEWGGLGDGCYDGCMSGATPPYSCSAGSGGGGGVPQCLGLCTSCDGWEWDVPKDVCVAKIKACTGLNAGAKCEGANPPADFGDYGGILTKKQCTEFGGKWTPPPVTTQMGGLGTPTGDTPDANPPTMPGTPGGGGGEVSGPDSTSDGSEGYQWRPNPYYPQGCFVPSEICKGCVDCSGVGGDVCGGCGGKACQEMGDTSMNPTPTYCLSGQWCSEHPHVGPPCGKCKKPGCSDGGCGNYNPGNWRYRKCGNKCQHLELYVGGQKITSGYTSGAIKRYGKLTGGKVVKGPPECKLFAPDSCCPDTINLEGKDRPVPYVRVTSIDIIDGGEGYTEIPLIKIDEPQFVDIASGGIQALATVEIDKDKDSPTYRQIIKVTIVKEGHGYADPHARRSSHIPSVQVLGGGLDDYGNPTVTRTAVLQVNRHWGLEAYTGTCKGTWWKKPGAGFPGGPTPTPSDQRYKENPACGCIAFNDCVPGNKPKAHHFWRDYTCDDVYVETKETFGNEVKSGNMVHIWNSVDKRRVISDPDGGTMGTPRWINGDFKLHRVSGNIHNIFRLGCSGRKASAKDTGCEAGYCHSCPSAKDEGCQTNHPRGWDDCCGGSVAAYPYGGTTNKNRCVKDRKGPCGSSAAESWPGCFGGDCIGGCDGEWFEGDCADTIINCTDGCGPDGKCSNDGNCISGDTHASVYVSKGKCKCTGGFGVTSTLTIQQYEAQYPEPLPLAGGSGWTSGAGPYAWFIGDEVRVMESCPGGELPDLGGAQCTDRVNGVLRTEQEMEECIAAQQDACLKQPATCWEAAKKCGEKCCGCIDCSYEKGAGAKCPDCCWEDDGKGNIVRCNECPDACPESRQQCCDGDCPRIDGIFDIDLSMGYRSGSPIISPQLDGCQNPNFPEFNGGIGGTPTNINSTPSLSACANQVPVGYASVGCQFSWDEANDPCPDEGSCSGKKAVVVQEDGEWKIKQVVVGVGGADKCDCETGGYCNGSVDPTGYECTDSSYTNETDCKAALGNIGWKPQLDGEACVAGTASWSFEARTGGSGPAAGINCSDIAGLLANTAFKTEEECCASSQAAPDGTRASFIPRGSMECGECRGLWNSATGVCMYSAGLNRGLPSCEPCTSVLGGLWDEYNGICKNVQGVKSIPCSKNFHTYWVPKCCEEKDCVQDTCGNEKDNDGNCCGYWATSSCSCPDLIKDCDGKQVYHQDANGNPDKNNPMRHPFMVDIQDSLHIGGCCGKWIVGGDALPPDTMPPVFYNNRIILTESS